MVAAALERGSKVGERARRVVRDDIPPTADRYCWSCVAAQRTFEILIVCGGLPRFSISSSLRKGALLLTLEAAADGELADMVKAVKGLVPWRSSTPVSVGQTFFTDNLTLVAVDGVPARHCE